MLINFFMELKKTRIPVSITELLQLIEVLKARLVYADIDEFYYLSRMTLVKDERHFDKFDRAFSAYFKGLEDLASLLSSLIPDEYLRREFEKSLSKEELEKIDRQCLVGGRMMARRGHGKTTFCHIKDRTGQIQVYIRKDEIGEENYEIFSLLDIGDFIGVSGLVFKTKTGEISVKAKKFIVLSKSIRPLPNIKEKEGKSFFAFEDKDLRYRNRHLDFVVNSDVVNVP